MLALLALCVEPVLLPEKYRRGIDSLTSQMSLLEILAFKSNCAHISDLKFLDVVGMARVLHKLEEIRPDEASLSEWNDALDYFAGAPAAKNRTEAKRRLIRHLQNRRNRLEAGSGDRAKKEEMTIASPIGSGERREGEMIG